MTRTIELDCADMAALMPMFIVVTSEGIIRGVGPLIAKLRPDFEFRGADFFDVFDVVRPSDMKSFGMALEQQVPLSLRFFDAPQTRLKGIGLPLHGTDLVFINLSFGISVVDAIRDYNLTNVDFAATDLTVEMLYLVEAKLAAMAEWGRLTKRLHGEKEAAENQALTDPLTGLHNRRGLDLMLQTYIDSGAPFSLMNLDLDFFKAVNDRYGHGAGDHVLRIVADVLSKETRAHDTVARVGGDEFVLVYRGVVDGAQLMQIAARIISNLERPISYEDYTCKISASIGISISLDYPSVDIEMMTADADAALYQSKHDGRGCATVFGGVSPAGAPLIQPEQIGPRGGAIKPI
ncbi:MAG: GGDEF domain-containing protein [Halocynthiibacter sp.]